MTEALLLLLAAALPVTGDGEGVPVGAPLRETATREALPEAEGQEEALAVGHWDTESVGEMEDEAERLPERLAMVAVAPALTLALLEGVAGALPLVQTVGLRDGVWDRVADTVRVAVRVPERLSDMVMEGERVGPREPVPGTEGVMERVGVCVEVAEAGPLGDMLLLAAALREPLPEAATVLEPLTEPHMVSVPEGDREPLSDPEAQPV